MGCVNASSKKSLHPDSQARQITTSNNAQLQKKQSKNSRLSPENIPINESIPSQFFINLPSGTSSLKVQNCQTTSIKAQKRAEYVHPNKKIIKFENRTSKTSDTVNPQKIPQNLNQGDQSLVFHRLHYGEAGKNKNNHRSIIKKQKETKISKNVKFNPDIQQKPSKNNLSKNKSNNQNFINSLQTHQGEVQINFSHRSSSAKPKKFKQRSPRGKSCNLFKTFQDDCIQDEQNYDYSKRNSKSAQNIKINEKRQK